MVEPVSGLLALAKPRRIKASHRRRGKVASGPIVQRYYDPGIGRFLSVDPVMANGSAVSFNRYSYANDNPYRFTDPDGRQACGKNTSCQLAQGATGGTSRINSPSGSNTAGRHATTTFSAPVTDEQRKNINAGVDASRDFLRKEKPLGYEFLNDVPYGIDNSKFDVVVEEPATPNAKGEFKRPDGPIVIPPATGVDGRFVAMKFMHEVLHPSPQFSREWNRLESMPNFDPIDNEVHRQMNILRGPAAEMAWKEYGDEH